MNATQCTILKDWEILNHLAISGQIVDCVLLVAEAYQHLGGGVERFTVRGQHVAKLLGRRGSVHWLSHIRSASLGARLRRIVTCIEPNQKNQPNLDLYLGRRYKICHFPFVVSYLCIGQNQKNQPNLVFYLVRRSKIFVSVTTLLRRLDWGYVKSRENWFSR